ncbi:MAG: hypothetical protein FJ095_08865 [Deltaproteobacteria bacterium]|nr:hypothetical protein [Deltaproteobacteria bacterium]
MAQASTFPRVPERGAAQLPPTLTLAEANRLADVLRPSWDEAFGSELVRSSRVDVATERASVRPSAAQLDEAPVRPSARPLPPPQQETDVRARRNIPSPVVDTEADDDAPILAGAPSSGSSTTKIAVGVAVLAVAGIAAFIATRGRPGAPPSATTAAATAATTAAVTATAKEISPPPPEVPAPKPEAPATTAATSAPASATAEPSPAAPPPAAEPPKPAAPPPAAAAQPAQKPVAAQPPPAAAQPPKTKTNSGGGGIVRDAPF